MSNFHAGWTAEDDAKLRRWWTGKRPVDWIAQALGRTEGAVRARANMLGLGRRMPRRSAFTPEEDAWLRAHYADTSYQDMADALGRTVNSVNARLRKLIARTKLDYWTEEEEDKLRALYPEHTADEIAQILGRTARAVRVKANALGLKKYGGEGAQTGRWTPEEDEKLRTMFGKYSSMQIGAELNRTRHAVEHHARELGLYKYRGAAAKAQAETAEQYQPNNAVELLPVCRSCVYREYDGGRNSTVRKTRYNSMCTYFLRTGELRPGPPARETCPGYKKR